MTVIYFADGVRINDAASFFEKMDLAAWLDNGEPGSLAGGSLNPVLHRKGE